MDIRDVFPVTGEGKYVFEYFRMVVPPKLELVDFSNVASFEPEFTETYLATNEGIAVSRNYPRNSPLWNVIPDWKAHFEVAGLFSEDHCLIPRPVEPRSRFVSTWGETQILDVYPDGFLVLETFDGTTSALKGYCKTRFTLSKWIEWQESDTDKMQYYLRRIDGATAAN